MKKYEHRGFDIIIHDKMISIGAPSAQVVISYLADQEDLDTLEKTFEKGTPAMIDVVFEGAVWRGINKLMELSLKEGTERLSEIE
jgi:hypothetical protein